MNDAVKIANSIDANTAVADFLQNNGINIGDADPQDLKYVLDSFQKRVLNKISKGQVATPDDFDSKERERFEIAVEQVKNWGADVAHTGLTRHYFYKTRDALHKKTQGNAIEATVAELKNQIEIGKTVYNNPQTDEVAAAITAGIESPADAEAREDDEYAEMAIEEARGNKVPSDIIKGLSQIKEIEEVPVTGEIKTPVLGDVAGVPDFERTENARPTKATQNEAPTVNELSDKEVSAAVMPALRSLATFEPKNNAPITPMIANEQDYLDNQWGEHIKQDGGPFVRKEKPISANNNVFSRILKNTSSHVATATAAIIILGALFAPSTSIEDTKNAMIDSSVSKISAVQAMSMPSFDGIRDKISNLVESRYSGLKNAMNELRDEYQGIETVNFQDHESTVANTMANIESGADELEQIKTQIAKTNKMEALITDGQQIADLGQELSETVKVGFNNVRQDVALAFAAEKEVSDFMTSTSDQVSAVAKQFDAYNQSKVIADIQRVDNDESYQLPSEFASLDREPVTEGAVIEVADNDKEYTPPAGYNFGDTVEFANAENLKGHKDEVQVAAAEISFTQKSVKISAFEVKAPVNYAALMKDGFTGSATDAPSVQGAGQFLSPTTQAVVNNNPTHPDLKDQAAGSENAVPASFMADAVDEKAKDNGPIVTASFMADAVKTTSGDKAIITASFMADAVSEKAAPDDKAIITASFMADAVDEKAKDNDPIVTASFMENAVSTAIPVPVNREVAQEAMVDTYAESANLDGDKISQFKSEAKSMEVAKAEIEVKNAPEMPATASGKVHSNPVTLENAEQAIQALKNSFADGAFPQSVQSQIDRIGTSTINADNFDKMRLYEAARDTMNYAQGHDSFKNVMSVFNYLAEHGSGNAAKLAKDAAKKKYWVASQLNVKVNNVSFDLANVKIIPTPKPKV